MARNTLTASVGWRSLGIAAILLATIPGPSPAARQVGAALVPTPDGPIVAASDAAGFRSGRWLGGRRTAEGTTLEVRFDDLLQEIGTGGLRMDRETLARLGQAAVGGDVGFEAMRVGDVLDRVGRIRVTSQGMSVLVGRRTLARVTRNLLGTDQPVEDLLVSDVLDQLTGAEVTADGVRDRLNQQTLLASLGGGLLGRVQRPSHAADPAFERRQALTRQYDRVVSLVRDVRREGLAGAEDNRLYDEAYNRLLQAKQADAVPLLDAHLRFEDELASALLPSMSRAERIAARWPARRRAFGADVAALLFGRKEAMERYEIDRLAIAADGALSAQDRAQRLQARRNALKVELAAQGSYVGFSEAPAAAPEVAAPEVVAPDEPVAGVQPGSRLRRRP